jgi:hypothetical protein
VKITDVIPHIVKPGLPGDTSDQSAWAFIEIQTERGSRAGARPPSTVVAEVSLSGTP